MATADDIQDVFARMLARYGSAWTGKFKGIPIEAVAQDWRETLHDIGTAGLSYGLSYLPPQFPPDAMQFRLICLSGNEFAAPKQIREYIKPDKPRLAAMLRPLVEKLRMRTARAWIEEIRDIPPHKRTAGQAQALRSLDETDGWYEPVDPQQLDKLKAETAARVAAYERQHP